MDGAPGNIDFFTVATGGGQVGGNSGIIVATDIWYTLAFTYDGAFMTVYKDGVLGGTPAAQTGTLDVVGGLAGDAFQVGDDVSASGNPMDGNINRVSIYERALCVGEIAELNDNPDLPIQQEPLVWLGQAPVGGTTPKGPLGHPLYGPFAGPIAC